MKGTLKFRAWDGREMVYTDKLTVGLYFFEEEGITEVVDGNAVGLTGVNWNIMLFTGLQDRCGCDIYEGDIIEFKANYVPQSKPSGYIQGTINWDEDKAGFVFVCFGHELEPYDLVDESDEGSYQWTVLGNIYETALENHLKSDNAS